jgi:hypothetical protein
MLRKIFFIIVIVCAVTAFTAESRAANISLGASSWYSWWEFKDNQSTKKMGPSLMLGPVVSVGLNNEWSLSAVLLIGKFKMKGDDSNMNLSRLDLDTTINYSLNRYFKVFSGIKYMEYTDTGFYHRSLGPALGIGLTVPVTDSLFFLANGSGIIMLGRHKNSEDSIVAKYKEPGYNTVLSLAYYIESISTTVNLGFRYQYFHTMYDDKSEGGNNDHSFYGPTLSIIYSF